MLQILEVAWINLMLFERDSLSKRTEYSLKIQVKDKTRNQVYDTVTARVKHRAVRMPPHLRKGRKHYV